MGWIHRGLEKCPGSRASSKRTWTQQSVIQCEFPFISAVDYVGQKYESDSIPERKNNKSMDDYVLIRGTEVTTYTPGDNPFIEMYILVGENSG